MKKKWRRTLTCRNGGVSEEVEELDKMKELERLEGEEEVEDLEKERWNG